MLCFTVIDFAVFFKLALTQLCFFSVLYVSVFVYVLVECANIVAANGAASIAVACCTVTVGSQRGFKRGVFPFATVPDGCANDVVFWGALLDLIRGSDCRKHAKGIRAASRAKQRGQATFGAIAAFSVRH